MARRVRGVLTREGVQTGDGRATAAGAITWAELPLPFAWLQQEQHGDLLAGAVQVGTIDTIAREDGGNIAWTGTVDDEQVDGAELVRRLEAGTASHGHRFGVSIDPDDWAVQVVDTTGALTDGGGEEDDDGFHVVAAVSGAGRMPALVAAAGDPDVEPEPGSILFEDAAGDLLMRFTRLRIRGVTACTIPAFADAYVELDDSEPDENTGDDDGAAPGEDAVTAAVTSPVVTAPVAPPLDWFTTPEPELGDERLVEQPGGGFACPLTITDDGHVYGHVAAAGTCHTGYPGTCVTPPTSQRSYADFHVGTLVTAEGSSVNVGTLVVGTDHAAADLLAPAARDHYANTGLSWAHVRVIDGEWGPWATGALLPTITPEVLRILRASALSGDWRRIGGYLELISGLSVNAPGFPIVREALAASGLATIAAAAAPRVHIEDGVQTSLVAAGVVVRCPECAERARMEAFTAAIGPTVPAEVVELLRKLDQRTRHLVPAAREHALARIRGGAR